MEIQERYLRWAWTLDDPEYTEEVLRKQGYHCFCRSSSCLRINQDLEVVCKTHWKESKPFIALKRDSTLPDYTRPTDSVATKNVTHKKTGNVPQETSELPRPRKKRHKLPDDIRQTLMVRANFHCEHCGATENPHTHHIVPIAKGGTDDLDNLLVLRGWCHGQEHKDSPIYKAIIANEHFIGHEHYVAIHGGRYV